MMVLNEDLHSPLTLAAAMPDTRDPNSDNLHVTAKKRMMEFLLDQLHSLRWEYGPVRREMVNLAGIETPVDRQKYPRLRHILESGRKTPTMKGAIAWLCETKSDDCITIDAIQRLIQSKWHLSGFKLFTQAGTLHFIMTFTLTALVCLVNATPHYSINSRVSLLPIDNSVSVLYPIVIAQVSTHHLILIIHDHSNDNDASATIFSFFCLRWH